MANIEVETRGPLTKEEFSNLKSFLDKQGRSLGEKKRFSLIYFRKGVPEKVIDQQDDPVDLRMRITNKKAEIVMKYGKWGSSDSRKEFLFPLENEKFEDAIEFLLHLGWGAGVLHPLKMLLYSYQGFTFSLVETSGIYYYEIEKIIENLAEKEKAGKEISLLIKKLRLPRFPNNEAFASFCDTLNQREGMHFDFKKEDFAKIRARFQEFF